MIPTTVTDGIEPPRYAFEQRTPTGCPDADRFHRSATCRQTHCSALRGTAISPASPWIDGFARTELQRSFAGCEGEGFQKELLIPPKNLCSPCETIVHYVSGAH